MGEPLDYSLRSPFGPLLRAFNAQTLLFGLRRDDGSLGFNEAPFVYATLKPK